MEQLNYEQKYKHLNTSERGKIEILKKEGYSYGKIAKLLNRNKSTISREIKRNSVEQLDTDLKSREVYFSDTAEILYTKRRINCGCKYKIGNVIEFIHYVEQKVLDEKWSPDAAIGRCKIDNPKLCGVSTKTFYNYIDLGIVKVAPLDLLLKVKLKRKFRIVRKHKKKLVKSIEQRPLEVEERKEFGHWEIDTVVGTRDKSSVLLTLTERSSRFEIIKKIENKSSECVVNAFNLIKSEYGELFPKLFKTLTADNGSEFSESIMLEKELGLKVYFAHPHSPFERGTNENHNGIIRRFIPKGKSINDISEDLVKKVETFMHLLPRKIFNYKTPIEKMAEFIAS